MKLKSLLPLLLLPAALSISGTGQAQTKIKPVQSKAHHMVVIWLKRHGDENARKKYIEGSKRLAKLPGVLDYHVGTPLAVKREQGGHAVDDSYDVAVSSTFESKQALENYLKHPEHHRVIKEVLKPLVDQYKVYDFVE